MSLAPWILLACRPAPDQELLPTRGVTPVECEPTVDREADSCPPVGDETTESECASAAACPGGICQDDPWGGAIGCLCWEDECRRDADCGPSATCSCSADPGSGWPSNRCEASNCRLDTDCPSGRCQRNRGGGCNSGLALSEGWYCATPEDECDSDADCEKYERCVWAGRFRCDQIGWTCD